jgi:hypothetical protein
MTVVKIVKEQFVSDLYEFLNEFDLMKQFLKDENLKSFDDWDFPTSDEEIIVKYLDQKEENYVVYYNDDGQGYFWIAEIEIEPLDQEEKTLILECLNNIKANPDILEVMDISDAYFEETIKKIREKWNMKDD